MLLLIIKKKPKKFDCCAIVNFFGAQPDSIWTWRGSGDIMGKDLAKNRKTTKLFDRCGGKS